jgi:hypothetical protein
MLSLVEAFIGFFSRIKKHDPTERSLARKLPRPSGPRSPQAAPNVGVLPDVAYEANAHPSLWDATLIDTREGRPES